MVGNQMCELLITCQEESQRNNLFVTSSHKQNYSDFTISKCNLVYCSPPADNGIKNKKKTPTI